MRASNEIPSGSAKRLDLKKWLIHSPNKFRHVRVRLLKQPLILGAENHMSNSVEYILLGDIGATNARFALLSNGKLNAINSFEVAKFGQFTDLLANFLKGHTPHTFCCCPRSRSTKDGFWPRSSRQ
jgi:hypothetical protein